MYHVTVFCFLASYLVAFGLELFRLYGRSKFNRLVLAGFGIAGFVAHTWYLLNRHSETHLPPLLASTHDWMLVLAWVLVLFYLFVTLVLSVSKQDLAVGVFALPVVLLLVGSAYFLSQDPGGAVALERARRGWGILHAALLVFGMTTGAAGLVSGIMYLIQHRRLRTRHAEPTGLRMPSLARLAQVNRWSMMLTFFLLTLGFASGIYLGLFPAGQQPGFAFTDPVVIGSGVVWLLFAGLFLRLLATHAPAGKQVAWMTISGCGFLLVTLLGLQVVTGNIHQRAGETKPEGHARRSAGGQA